MTLPKKDVQCMHFIIEKPFPTAYPLYLSMSVLSLFLEWASMSSSIYPPSRQAGNVIERIVYSVSATKQGL